MTGPVGRQFNFTAAEECDKLFTKDTLQKSWLLLENVGGSGETVCDFQLCIKHTSWYLGFHKQKVDTEIQVVERCGFQKKAVILWNLLGTLITHIFFMNLV